MISAVHDELDAPGDGAEFPDDQFVADEIIEVCDMLLELVCAINIIIVGVVSDDDAGILHHILDEAKPWKIRIREGSVRVGPVGDITHDGKFRFIEYKYRRISDSFGQVMRFSGIRKTYLRHKKKRYNE